MLAATGASIAAEEAKQPEKLKLEMVGVRVAYSATRIDEDFAQGEAYARLSLPKRWDFGRDWHIRLGLDMSAGMLGRLDEEDKGFIATLGPVFTLRSDRFPVDLVVGSSPTIMSRHTYDGVDFGIPFQFTSHIGFNAHLTRRWALGYRFQHMSNASLSSHNPGLDMHSVSIGFKF